MNLTRILSKYKTYTIIFFTGCILFSCIPTKKVVYVQDDDKEGEVATYKPIDFHYKVSKGDRFYLKVTDISSGLSFGSSDISMPKEEQANNVIQQSPSVQDYLVLEDGTIDYPVIGRIPAEGLTMDELQASIRKKCEGFISNPSIKLFMTNFNVTVLGEVNSSGFFQLITDRPTLFDAIGQAKDMTDFADRKRVKIIRRVGDNVTVKLIDVTQPGFINSEYYYLHPNDVIHVMPLKVKKYSSDNALPLFLSVITTIVTIISITSR